MLRHTYKLPYGVGMADGYDLRGKAVDVLLAEFNALRAEMNQKKTAQITLVSLNVTAFATIIGFVGSQKAAASFLLVLPIASSTLGLLTLAQNRDVWTAARYIENTLRPLVAEYLRDNRLLGWEVFYGSNRIHRYLNSASLGLLFPAASSAVLVLIISSLAGPLELIAWLCGWALILAQAAVWAVRFRANLRNYPMRAKFGRAP
jgi:hypothetical protein